MDNESLKSLWIVTVLGLALAGCPQDEGAKTNEAGGGAGNGAGQAFGAGMGAGAGTGSSGAGAGDSGGAGTGGSSGGGELKPPPVGAVCTVGDQQPCTCATGSGVQTCVDGSGIYSQCACEQAWPYPGDVCGQNECPPAVAQADEMIEFAPDHCCTPDGACGLKKTKAFGDTCFARGKEPPGVPDESCAYVVPFVELHPCCRPDNKCGLWFAESPGWDDLGCVERSQMGNMMKNSAELNFFLTYVKFVDANTALTIPELACDYPQ